MFEARHYVPINSCSFIQLPIFRRQELKVSFGYPERVSDFGNGFGNVGSTFCVSLSVVTNRESEEETPHFVLGGCDLLDGGVVPE